MDKVITLSRQFGSGGSEIAAILGKSLNVPVYDKKILEDAAGESGIAREHFEKADEKRNSFLFSLVSAHYAGTSTPLPLSDIILEDRLFAYTAQTIKKLAASPCIVVGRCADDVLRELPNLVRVYIYADFEDRVKRIMQLYEIEEKAATTLVKKTDKKRANYYNFYTSKNWGVAENYDICINSSRSGVQGAADTIKEFALISGKNR